ncbi:MAG: PAS domain S-box protein [Terriglobales bacterium]|jgi:PAS domain S-box-containing protein
MAGVILKSMRHRLSSNLGIRLRFSSWPTALIAIVVIKVALSFAVKPGSSLFSYSGISYFLLLLLATVFAIRNGIHNTLGGRPFWLFLAIGYGLWALDQWIFLYYELIRHVDVPDTSIADPALFLHLVPFMAAVATLPHRNLTDRKLYRTISNSLLLLFFWSFLYGYAVVPYQYLFSNASGYALRFDILYLLENWALVLALGILILRVRGPWKPIYIHLLGASTLYALSSAVANFEIDAGGYVNGKLYGLGLIAAVCWFVWIPLRARELTCAEEQTIQPHHRAGSQASAWAMFVVLLISIPIVSELFQRDEPSGLRTFRLLVALAAIVCLSFAAYIKEYLAKSKLASDLGLANQRLRLAVEAGKSVGWEWDIKAGRYSWFGDLQTMFAIPSDTFIGPTKDFYRYIHPEDRTLVSKAVADAKQNHTLYTAEFRVVRLDGTVRWVAASGQFYYGTNGEPVQMLGMAVDITEHKSQEATLRESEERLRIAAEVGRMYAWEWDPSSDAVRRSAECVGILGLSDVTSPDTAKEYFNLIHPDDRAKLWSAVDSLTSENPVYRTQYRRFRPDGALLWLEESGRATFDENGKMIRLVGMTADITERKQAEQALAESEARERTRAKELETILDAVPVPVRIAHDAACRRMTGNLAACEQARVPPGQNLSSSAPPGQGPRYRLMENGAWVAPDSLPMQQAAATGKPVLGRALTVVYEDGTERQTVESAVPLLDEAGNPRGAVGTSIDLTELKQAEQAQRESEEKLRLLLDSAAEAIYGIDLEHRCTFCNPACLRILGYERIDEVLGRNMHHLIHHSRPDGTMLPEDECRIHRVAITGEGIHAEDEVLWKADGTSFPAEYWSYPQRREHTIVGAVVAFVDITERKQSQAALAGVSRRLIEAQERERSRIARELHDDIGQRLAMLSIDLGLLPQDFPDLPAEARGRVDDLLQQISDIAADIQSLSHTLHSSKLQYLGIATAMKSFCREYGEQQHALIDFQNHDVPTPLPPDLSLCLFRVLQEALHNSAKHSGVRHFQVELCGTLDQIHLTVRDSGVGFDPQAVKQGPGLGLVSMEERLKLLNGTFSIESQPGRGTIIHASVPVTSVSPSLSSVGDPHRGSRLA